MSPRSLLPVALLVSACAPRLATIALSYPAPGPALQAGEDAGAISPVAAAAEVLGERRVEVALFVDGRHFAPVAEKRDGGDRRTALYEAAEPVGVWLRRGIEQELLLAGIEAVDREADLGAPLRLSGRLREAFATERSGTEACVSFHAMLRCAEHGEVLLSRTYSGSALLPEDAPDVSGAAGDAPGAALALALQQGARDLARDLARVPACGR